ncbi:LRR 8 domain containing protein [Asbolus verrucosus]|uniref:LRR 8 domain containing protein n=1 Tax=Asbolus verrucosus TaxID=1661398 RepID=A0A482VC34_ASBVE|nr:LRR 8 domain containing protein [Asbolus verrucosus]
MLYFKYIITILFVDGNYKQLKQLDIINSKVSFIDDGTFCDLEQLMELNMAKNFITRLNHNIFGPNKLWKFVISDNMLSDLKDFDINYFPNLKFFDISNNKLKTLPINLLEKLKKDKNFTISAKSNPWNCTNKNWTRLLDTVLFHKFCDDNQPEFVDEMPRFLAIEAPPKPNFISCAFWIAGAFWIGIIVGNIFLIRRTLFRKVNKTKVNQSTQLNFSNNNLPRLIRKTFTNYKQVEHLLIINSRVSFINDGAFYDLKQLKEVNIAKNFIAHLSSKMFGYNSNLRKLVVSDMLNDLDSFDISYFPKLAIFDIINNKIKILPENVLEKLEDDSLIVLIGNNSWDCANKSWSRILNPHLFQKFCINRGSQIFKEMPKFLAMKTPRQTDFPSCTYWIIRGFWVVLLQGIYV